MSAAPMTTHVLVRVYAPRSVMKAGTERRRHWIESQADLKRRFNGVVPCGREYSYTVQNIPLSTVSCLCGQTVIEWMEAADE